MSSHNESEYDDRPAPGSERRAQAARPAWDAATYGHPEDTRRREPPPVGRGATGSVPTYTESVPTYTEYAYPAAEDYGVPAVVLSPLRVDSGPSDSGSDYGPGSGSDYPPELTFGSYASVPDDDAPAHATTPAEYAMDQYPGGLSAEDDRVVTRSSRRSSGRNLPAAIGVGVGLGALVVASLFLWRPAFLGVLVVAVGIAIWELVRAIRLTEGNPPLIPLVAGGALMACLAWWGQGDALTFGLVVTILAVMVWRLADGVGGYARDVYAAALIAVYVPFLAGFAALLATADNGDLRVLAMVIGVVFSDTGGFIAGSRFGRHPMAPSVSPNKTWEGLAGSLLTASIGSAILLAFLFDLAPWWGAVFGLGVAAAAVLGDLGESMVKRDLGVKDMSGLLPGHGGLMDRLDSLVFAAPTAYVLFTLLMPSTS